MEVLNTDSNSKQQMEASSYIVSISKRIVFKFANQIKLEMLIEKTFNFTGVLNHTHANLIMDFASLY